MIVAPSLVKAYPEISSWICGNLPKVKTNTKVFRAFQKYAGFDEKIAERAILHGNPPNIEYRNMPADNGQYDPKYPGIVFISMKICDMFKEYNTDQRMHILVESTLLHEMVHWGNALAKYVPPQEQGKAFEKEAYGKDIRCFWSGCGL